MSGQGELAPAPAPDPLGSIGLLADPMPMPRARARVAGKWPNQFVQFYEPKAAMTRQADFGRLWGQLGLDKWPAHRPLELRAWFIFGRPLYHYGTGRNAGVVKPRYLDVRPGKGGGVAKDADGGDHPTGGDLDNLIKLVKDGLSGTAYEDDGCVAVVSAEKLYVDQAGVESARTVVELRPLA